MKKASAAAAAALGLGEADAAAAQGQAAELIRNSAGMEDLRYLLYSMGLPATRLLLRQQIRADADEPTRGRLLAEVEALSALKEVGCMRIDFFNRLTGSADAAYLVLDECPKDHDLGAQLDSLKVHVSSARWPEIQKHLSALVLYARTMYAQTARENLPLLRRLLGAAENDPCSDRLTVRVDPANTTLFVAEESPLRVGIWVRFEAAGAPP